MAILYGTTDTAEVLPVQVNSKGQLVAEGLQGPQGEIGPPGLSVCAAVYVSGSRPTAEQGKEGDWWIQVAPNEAKK